MLFQTQIFLGIPLLIKVVFLVFILKWDDKGFHYFRGIVLISSFFCTKPIRQVRDLDISEHPASVLYIHTSLKSFDLTGQTNSYLFTIRQQVWVVPYQKIQVLSMCQTSSEYEFPLHQIKNVKCILIIPVTLQHILLSLIPAQYPGTLWK